MYVFVHSRLPFRLSPNLALLLHAGNLHYRANEKCCMRSQQWPCQCQWLMQKKKKRPVLWHWLCAVIQCRQERRKRNKKRYTKRNNSNVKMHWHIKRQLEYKCGSQSGIEKNITVGERAKAHRRGVHTYTFIYRTDYISFVLMHANTYIFRTTAHSHTFPQFAHCAKTSRSQVVCTQRWCVSTKK